MILSFVCKFEHYIYQTNGQKAMKWLLVLYRVLAVIDPTAWVEQDSNFYLL